MEQTFSPSPYVQVRRTLAIGPPGIASGKQEPGQIARSEHNLVFCDHDADAGGFSHTIAPDVFRLAPAVSQSSKNRRALRLTPRTKESPWRNMGRGAQLKTNIVTVLGRNPAVAHRRVAQLDQVITQCALCASPSSIFISPCSASPEAVPVRSLSSGTTRSTLPQSPKSSCMATSSPCFRGVGTPISMM